MINKEKFKIEGMHCASCKTLIETEIDSLHGVKNIQVNHQNGEATLEFDKEKIVKEEIFSSIEKLNYKVFAENGIEKKKDVEKNRWLTIFYIFIAIIIFTLVFLWLKSLGVIGVMAKLNEGEVAYMILFAIGLLTGFHCIGMCGGLVVAYSVGSTESTSSKNNKKYYPHLQYNIARIISYTIIGAILGSFGSFFGINPSFTGIVLFLAGFLMIAMGLSFLTNFAIFKKIKLKTPDFIARFLYNQKRSKNPKGPFVIGLLNGLMPCGPLQAMQLYALTTGSATKGALAMAFFALGTVPMMFGFGVLISKISRKYIGRIIKFSGVLIIILGLIMINRALNNFGTGINMSHGENYQAVDESIQEFQEINMDLTYSGYSPNVLYFKKDIPVRWIINVKQMTGCTNAIMIESLGIKKDLKIGKNIIEFIPPKNIKEIKFSCWMRMVWGKFVVID